MVLTSVMFKGGALSPEFIQDVRCTNDAVPSILVLYAKTSFRSNTIPHTPYTVLAVNISPLSIQVLLHAISESRYKSMGSKQSLFLA